MPFGWGESADAFQQVQNTDDDHKGSLTHELIAGAAAFYAFKKFEDSKRAEGQPIQHAFAKELLAGFAGAEADRLFETKGLDFLDSEMAKHKAKENTEQMYNEQYGDGNDWDPNSQGPDFGGLL